MRNYESTKWGLIISMYHDQDSQADGKWHLLHWYQIHHHRWCPRHCWGKVQHVLHLQQNLQPVWCHQKDKLSHAVKIQHQQWVIAKHALIIDSLTNARDTSILRMCACWTRRLRQTTVLQSSFWSRTLNATNADWTIWATTKVGCSTRNWTCT